MTSIRLGAKRPSVDGSAWVAPGVVLAGDVTVLGQASIWYGTVVRADRERIRIGAGSNVQDCCVLHADPGFPLLLADGVSVGHRAVLHGCEIEEGALVGMGAVVLNGARVGAGSLVAAGTVLLEGTRVPPNSLVAGVPGKVRRDTTGEEQERIRRTATTYRELKEIHALGELAAM